MTAGTFTLGTVTVPGLQHFPPPFEQIASHYRGQIERGELAPGAFLPTEAEIMAAWGVAKATANKAVALLKTEGLVAGRVGVGTVVLERPQP